MKCFHLKIEPRSIKINDLGQVAYSPPDADNSEIFDFKELELPPCLYLSEHL